MQHPIPEELSGIYKPDEYEKQCSYLIERRKFNRITGGLDTVMLIGILFSGLIGITLDYFNGMTGSLLWGAVVFIAAYNIISVLYSLPFDYYSTFVIETKYGFNKSTKKLFLSDTVKSTVISVILTSVIYLLIHCFYNEFGSNFWIFVYIIVMAIIIVMNMLYSQIIVPLFNKQTPLENGELRDAIEEFAERNKFKIKDIYVINGSKRSTKANAYFSGMGKTKRIVLYDTLIEQLSPKEIVAVLAHEIGHYKHHDIYKNLIFSTLSVGIYLFIFSFLADSTPLANAMGSDSPSLLLSIIAFGLLLTPVSLFLSPVLNLLSQKNEYNADNYAAANGLGEDLINALKKLTAKNFSPLTVHPLYAVFYYSHPTLLQRINNIKKYQK